MGQIEAGSRLGLIAGDGDLPLFAARALRDSGRLVGAVALRGVTDERLAREAVPVRWCAFGELDAAVAALRAFGARQVLLVGGVPKRALFAASMAEGMAEGMAAGRAEGETVVLDASARGLLAGAAGWADDALFRALAGWIEAHGFSIARQDRALAGLLAPRADFSGRAPTDAERSDVELGRRALAAVGAVGIGQCVVVRRGCIVAVEAVEGTDEAIRRAGRLAGPGCVVVKGRRAGQDPRFDLPAVGPGTIAAMVEAGARCLAVEAGATLLLDREALRSAADRADVACTAFCVEPLDRTGDGRPDRIDP